MERVAKFLSDQEEKRRKKKEKKKTAKEEKARAKEEEEIRNIELPWRMIIFKNGLNAILHWKVL